MAENLPENLTARLKERDPAGRICSAALAVCLLFNIVLHTFYHISYEGMFLYTGHTLFFMIGLTAPLLIWIGRQSPALKWSLRASWLIFAVFLAARHIHLLFSLGDMVGLPAADSLGG